MRKIPSSGVLVPTALRNVAHKDALEAVYQVSLAKHNELMLAQGKKGSKCKCMLKLLCTLVCIFVFVRNLCVCCVCVIHSKRFFLKSNFTFLAEYTCFFEQKNTHFTIT